jgi:hypothetical protein
MDPQFKTSFIPKKSMGGPMPGSAVSRLAGFNFMTLLATVIFLASALFAAGLYIYNATLESQIESQVVTLRKASEAFEPNFIAQATRLNKRIVAASRILERHISPSAIFRELELTTLQTIALNSFTFSDNVEGKIVVRGSGEGDSFRSIVLQSDEFGKNGFMRDVLFAGLAPNARGNVDFTFEATLDPQIILFQRGLVPTGSETEEDVPAVEQLEDENLGVFGSPDQQQ